MIRSGYRATKLNSSSTKRKEIGSTMALTVLYEIPGLTQDQYDEIIKELQAGGITAQGRIFHVAGPMEGGWQVVDVFESQAAFEQFIGGSLGPVMQKLGIAPPQIKLSPVHNMLRGPEHHL
jgi:hypothetical protein